MSFLSAVSRRPGRLAVTAVGLLGLLGLAAAPSMAASTDSSTTFNLHPNKSVLNCLSVSGKPKPTASVTVTPGALNDKLKISLANFKPGLTFDLFTVQRSNQLADGSPNPTPGFGLAWYQSDLNVGSDGTGSATIHTILLNQIFGFDPDTGVALAPTNTFHVGFWFNKPSDAAACGFTGTTPFNGEHNAGPVAMISRPNATTGLGPLCTDPNTSTNPATCNP